ncbi:uncharacterized protein LOC100828559 [Brachypodium distachyon]|nr:uncharacterized protein LOC100828559 [Brachypodium distachyon]XP_014751309.1 uncharacterized protein LOC100828559 [Brachypodium distachyon]XP_014751310.1 uncharacterized protein LOC100828559 [Brachypodium distachyon]|eukprot:XP_014751308.1 uncharacterized protein LOC100828559 [Brachypodium distachyon]
MAAPSVPCLLLRRHSPRGPIIRASPVGPRQIHAGSDPVRRRRIEPYGPPQPPCPIFLLDRRRRTERRSLKNRDLCVLYDAPRRRHWVRMDFSVWQFKGSAVLDKGHWCCQYSIAMEGSLSWSVHTFSLVEFSPSMHSWHMWLLGGIFFLYINLMACGTTLELKNALVCL